MDKRGLILLDQLSHRSIVDACTLAGSELHYFAHNNMAELADLLARYADGKRRILIISEGIFSMDGDIGHLPQLIALKKKYEAFLMVDDAHAFGTLGPNGRGSCDYFGIDAQEVDIWTGALSKAVPGNGGFVAGCQELIFYMQHGSAPYIFSGALSPINVAVARESIRIFKEEGPRLEKLRLNETLLRNELQYMGYDTGLSQTHVIPVLLDEDDAVCKLAKGLFEHKILASAVVFPAVPIGKGRIRLCSNANYTPEMLDHFLAVMKKLKA